MNLRLAFILGVVAASICPLLCKAEESATRPSTTVHEAASIGEAITKGVQYLIKFQTLEGAWGTGLETRGFEVYSSVPGTHEGLKVATTALCVMALREVGDRIPGAKQAHDKGLEFLVTKGYAYRDHGALIYNVWAHTYTLQCLAIEMRDNSQDPRLKKMAEWHLDRLQRYETFMGGWNYYDFDAQTQHPSMPPTSFGTAAGLVALYEARHSGIQVPQKMIDRAQHRLEEMRLPTGAYLYSGDHKYFPRHPANQVRGSVGRTQSGNFALWLLNSPKMDRAKVKDGLEMFFREHEFIEMGRKRQFPHEAWYKTAPYYFYFGHYYTARLLEKLGPEEGKKKYGKDLAHCIMPWQEPDGSWWDFAMWDFHKPYGTAFAVMTLLRCE